MKITNRRLLDFVQIHENTLALLQHHQPVYFGDVYEGDDEDVDAYRLDFDAAAAQVDALSYEVFWTILLGIPALYNTDTSGWDEIVYGPLGGVARGDALDRFLLWCGETWAWHDF